MDDTEDCRNAVSDDTSAVDCSDFRKNAGGNQEYDGAQTLRNLKRIFDEKIEDEFNRRLKKAVKRQQKLIASGIRALVYREEPFTTAKDSLEFHVYLMIDEKCRKNRKVRIEEVR